MLAPVPISQSSLCRRRPTRACNDSLRGSSPINLTRLHFSQDEKWELNLRVRKLELQLEQARHSLSKAEEDSLRLTESSVEFQGKIADLQREADRLRAEVETRDRQTDHNAKARITLENRVAEQDQEIGEHDGHLADRDARIRNLEAQAAAKDLEIARLGEKIQNLQADVERQRGLYAEQVRARAPVCACVCDGVCVDCVGCGLGVIVIVCLLECVVGDWLACRGFVLVWYLCLTSNPPPPLLVRLFVGLALMDCFALNPP